VLIKFFIILLLFVTLWVILILVAKHLKDRGFLAPGARLQPPASPQTLALPVGLQPASRGACCLEIPCSDECAREHQAMRDRLSQRYDLVAAEALKVIGQSQVTDLNA
jgi:hypothetical protein